MRNHQRLIVAIITLVSVFTTVHAIAADTNDTPAISAPNIPTRTFTITDFGAVAGGSTLCTDAITKAIDACNAAGGGTVVVPPGRFLSAAFKLCSKLNLKLEKGATLLLSDNFTDYAVEPRQGYVDQITANDCTDVAITGEGTIDGQGAAWWAEFNKTKNAPPEVQRMPHRPYMIAFDRCTRVLMQGVTLTNSASFHFVPHACTDVKIEGITILAPANAPNTDGLDPSGWNYLITNCLFDTGDDCIAIKPSGKPNKSGRLSCENFTITNCTFRHGHGLSIGGQTPGGLRHLRVSDCTFDSTDAGIRMKANRGSGGLVEDCVYERLTMKNVKYPIYITSYYPERQAPKKAADDPAQPVNALTPIWRNIRIRDVTATDGPNAGRILGLAEMPISDIELERVTINAAKGFDLWNVNNIRFVQSTITAEKGPAVNAQLAEQVTGIDMTTGEVSK